TSLGDRPGRGAPGPDPQQSQRISHPAHRRRGPHRPRRGHRRHAGRRGVRRWHRRPDRHGLFD
ncbi:hypothetical protein LTR94_038284, partial [Friedmanniomyces endolithicus]